jgi:hypothetical protein
VTGFWALVWASSCLAAAAAAWPLGWAWGFLRGVRWERESREAARRKNPGPDA